MLKGKHVLLGVTGGIAAYKAANLASLLVKCGAQVHVVMTENATQFITPLTFETLTGRRCIVDTFERNFTFEVEHISLAQKADIALVAPATANVIAKLAAGLADDMLTTTLLACRCPCVVAPAMNTAMYQNPVTARNLKTLEELGFLLVPPAVGRLACGDEGPGKLPEETVLMEYLRKALSPQDLRGKQILVTAGPTQEALDPVRFITNHSSGKMGYAIARCAALRGADVTLVSGPTALPVPAFVTPVPVVTARDMFEAVTGLSERQDIIIMAAAVGDFRPVGVAEEKIKKAHGQGVQLQLTENPDILQWLGAHKSRGQIICGFAMETQNLVDNAREKLRRKQIDLIAANDLREAGAGFQVDTNRITIITQNEMLKLGLLSKEETAQKLLDYMLGQCP